MPHHPFSISGIDHIVLRVQRAAARRSNSTVTCSVAPLEREQPELGLTQLRAGRSLIDLVAVDGPLGARRGARAGAAANVEHFCLTIAPFEEAALSPGLAARGVSRAERRVRATARRARDARSIIEDPDGNRIELKAALDAGRPRGKGRPP